MGCADVIPGISGGTIALMLGIYEELIESIKTIDLAFLKSLINGRFKEAFDGVAWKFLFSLLTGIALAFLTLAKVISWLLTNKPVLINAFFFGLIIATVPVIARLIKKWTWINILIIALSAFLSFHIVTAVPINTPESPLFLFLCGFISICAMILPGISGSFILVLLGKYQYILDAIHNLDILPIIIVILGMATGILSFVRVLSWLFHRFHDLTVAILTGLVIGSLNKIWPWKETLRTIEGRHGKIIPVEQINILPVNTDSEFFLAIALIVFGFILATLLNKQPLAIKSGN